MYTVYYNNKIASSHMCNCICKTVANLKVCNLKWYYRAAIHYIIIIIMLLTKVLVPIFFIYSLN